MIKLFKKDEYRNQGRSLSWGSGPRADWKIMFSAFLLLLFLSVGYSTKIFLSVNGGSFESNLNNSTEILIDKQLLQKNVGFYRDREAGFEILLTTKEVTPDPSK